MYNTAYYPIINILAKGERNQREAEMFLLSPTPKKKRNILKVSTRRGRKESRTTF